MKQRKKSGLFFGFFAFREMASPLCHAGSKVLFARKKVYRDSDGSYTFLNFAGLGNEPGIIYAYFLTSHTLPLSHILNLGSFGVCGGGGVEQPIVFALHVAQISKEPRQVQPLSLSLIPLPLLILIF
jgi:hypothetical protein